MGLYYLLFFVFFINILWAIVCDASNPILMDDLNSEAHPVVGDADFLQRIEYGTLDCELVPAATTDSGVVNDASFPFQLFEIENY